MPGAASSRKATEPNTRCRRCSESEASSGSPSGSGRPSTASASSAVRVASTGRRSPSRAAILGWAATRAAAWLARSAHEGHRVSATTCSCRTDPDRFAASTRRSSRSAGSTGAEMPHEAQASLPGGSGTEAWVDDEDVICVELIQDRRSPVDRAHAAEVMSGGVCMKQPPTLVGRGLLVVRGKLGGRPRAAREQPAPPKRDGLLGDAVDQEAVLEGDHVGPVDGHVERGDS